MVFFSVLYYCVWRGIAAWFWLKKQPADSGILGGIPNPLRKGLIVNEKIFQHYVQRKPPRAGIPKIFGSKTCPCKW